MLLVMTSGTLVVLNAYGALPVLSLQHEGRYYSNYGLGKRKFGNFVSVCYTNSKNLKFSVRKSFCDACLILVPLPNPIRMLPMQIGCNQWFVHVKQIVMSLPHFWLELRPT
jgi:hypothetical protein